MISNLDDCRSSAKIVEFRRTEFRNRMRRHFTVALAAGGILAFSLGAVSGYSRGLSEGIWQASTAASAVTQDPVDIEAWEKDPFIVPLAAAPAKIVPDIPWSAETQVDIFNAVGRDPSMFAAVMAIASVETGFNTETVGDHGRSIGPYQIQPRWHADLLASYGWNADALKDPVKGAIVASDILRSLQSDYGFGTLDSDEIFMAYNAGPSGAREMLRSGKASSEYSRKAVPVAMEYFEAAVSADVEPAG